MGHKKFAIALKDTAIKGYMVVVIVAMENHIKLVEKETILLFSIALCFFSFSDHSVVHC
jgi:hypothetical protein